MYIHFFSIFSFPTSLHFFFLLYNLVLGRRDAFYTSRRRSLGVYAVLVHLIASGDRGHRGYMCSCKIVWALISARYSRVKLMQSAKCAEKIFGWG